MRKIVLLGGAAILLSGCSPDAKPIAYTYLPEVYDTVNLTDLKKDDPKLGALIKQVCATKRVAAPKDYAVGTQYFVNLVSQFPESMGEQAVYLKTKQDRFLYCHDYISKPGYHKLTPKQDRFSSKNLVTPHDQVEFQKLSSNFEESVRLSGRSLMTSARQLTVPTTGYLVVRATNDQTKQTVVTNVMELTPFIGSVPLVLESNIQIQEPYEVQLNLMGQARYRAPIHSSKERSTIQFKEAPHEDGTYGTVTVKEKTGKTTRYQLTVKHEQQLPPNLDVPPDELYDADYSLPRFALFHDRPLGKLKFVNGDLDMAEPLSPEAYIETSLEESKQLVRLISASEESERKGRLAERPYLTLMKNGKAQQFKIYLDRRIKKTDIYLEDVHRKISFKLPAEGRDLLLDTYQVK
ncbi:hypothetical protein [Exiguobacterium artemiae]|uniref:hypothetical protein n=1 Tax=Exiguobacterium artemiae TaxID=340145 RepID=UPI00296450CB|nr:hypothetical protein [Exiguobacterium sibiricum]MDW2885397.1 hypothetical protein [Exiguobacterium sibiricum]